MMVMMMVMVMIMIMKMAIMMMMITFQYVPLQMVVLKMMMLMTRIITIMFVFATFCRHALRLIAHLHRETNKLCTFGQINDDDDDEEDDGYDDDVCTTLFESAVGMLLNLFSYRGRRSYSGRRPPTLFRPDVHLGRFPSCTKTEQGYNL